MYVYLDRTKTSVENIKHKTKWRLYNWIEFFEFFFRNKQTKYKKIDWELKQNKKRKQAKSHSNNNDNQMNNNQYI